MKTKLKRLHSLNLGKLFHYLLSFLFFQIPLLSLAQQKDSLKIDHKIFPIIFYLPETSLGFGGTGIATFKLKNESNESPFSQILYSAAYTLKNQTLIYSSFQIFRNEGIERLKGELGFYNYFYNYSGIGQESNLLDLELYDVVFPRIYFSYARRLTSKISVGLGYKFDHFNITNIEPNGLLDTDKPIGYQGGVKSNIFYLIYYDTRDNVISSSKGIYLEAEFNHNILFKDFNYSKLNLDVRYFYSFNKNLVLANQIYFSTISSGAPFFDLPYLSTPKRARGFEDRRYLDYNLLNYQSELRYPIYKRIKGAIFFSTSFTSAMTSQLFEDQALFAFGTGIRYQFSEVDKTRFRLDFAFGGDSMQIYLTANEAF